jgi:hypothetical protein
VLAVFGIPCPACGLTTAFAHLAQLEVQRSLSVQPLGLPLFVLALLLVPLSALGVARSWSITRVLTHLRAERLALGITLAALVVWVARLAAG